MFRWDPEPRKLFIREMWSNLDLIEVHLACIVRPRLHPNAGLPYVTILEQEYGITSPKYVGSVFQEYMYGKDDMVTEHRRVCRRLADDQDIHLMMEKWDTKERNIRPDDWMEHIANRCLKEEKLLTQEEFDRLMTIAQKHVTMHPLNKRQR